MKYIGITDFSDISQVRNIKSIFSSFPKKTEHKLMAGVMMSHKTFHGLPTKWANAWPKKEEIPMIFSETEGVVNTLHYADYNLQSLADDYHDAIKLCGPNLHAFQFDVPWPNPSIVRMLKNAHRDLFFILQIGKVAFDKIGWASAPDDLVFELESYDDCIDCVLLDMSGGQGKPINTDFIIPYIDEIRAKLPKMEIAVAGGLGPETVHLLQPIVKIYGNNFSIDAQGRLRKSGSALDPIDWNLAEVYIQRSLELLYP